MQSLCWSEDVRCNEFSFRRNYCHENTLSLDSTDYLEAPMIVTILVDSVDTVYIILYY